MTDQNDKPQPGASTADDAQPAGTWSGRKIRACVALGGMAVFLIVVTIAILPSLMFMKPVAATVNGVDIKEDTVTAFIERSRVQLDLTDEDAWGTWLAQNGYTAESVRDEAVEQYITRELIHEAAGEQRASASEADVEREFSAMRARYESDEAWNAALDRARITEDEYRAEIAVQLEAEKLRGAFASEAAPSNDELLPIVQNYAKAYTGAKRSSQIVFAYNDKEKAQQVLDRIKAGQITFEEAARQYSLDERTAGEGGDMGWDKLYQLEAAYTEALANLEPGQMSDLVVSISGVRIIKCTGRYDAPSEVTSIDQVPPEWVESISSALESSNQYQRYNDWLEGQRQKANVTVNPMPEGLPYYVDVTPYLGEDGESKGDAKLPDPLEESTLMQETQQMIQESAAGGGE